MDMIEVKYKRYKEYKDSGVEWIGEIPKGWNFNKIKFVSDVFNGDSLNEKQKNKYSSENESHLAYISSKDINLNDSSINYNNGLRIPPDKISLKVAEKESTLLCIEGGSAGKKIAFNKQNVCFVNKLAAFKANDKFDDKYLFFTLKAGVFQTQFSLGLSGLIGGVSLSSINNFFIATPPLSEQTAIANFLDEKTAKIDKAIAQKEKMIALLKERKQIVIQDLVTGKWTIENGEWKITPPEKIKDSGVEWIGKIPKGWEVKRLKYVAKINPKSLPENTNPNLEFEYVDIGSVTFENGIEKTDKYTFKNSPSRARRIATQGDTVISTVRTYLKAIDFILAEKINFIYSTGFAVLHAFEELYNKFLFHFIRSNAFTEQVRINSTGMSYPAINSTDLGKLFFCGPPKKDQTAIVQQIETQSAKIDKAIALQQKQIEKLKEYKATLIDSAVTGKIKVI